MPLLALRLDVADLDRRSLWGAIGYSTNAIGFHHRTFLSELDHLLLPTSTSMGILARTSLERQSFSHYRQMSALDRH